MALLITTYVLSIALMIVLPVILAMLWRRHFAFPWFLFCVGMLIFIVSQLVHLPLNEWLSEIGILVQPGLSASTPIWRTALIVGMTAGLCEELARAGGYLILRNIRSEKESVMLGLGHGGIESMIFGGVQIAAALSALIPLNSQDLTHLNLTADQLLALKTQISSLMASPWNAFLPLVERIIAISIHVVFSLIVLQTFKTKQPGYLIIAIVYHTLIDMGAVMLAQTSDNPLLIEFSFAVVCLPGWIWAIWLLRKQSPLVQRTQLTSLLQELRTFQRAIQKELLHQWRTKRLLAILAVFGVFGMTSPLMAYFMPEMFKIIPGAEQFADLIPPPTQADALIQYMKNLTQFGFLLAIFLGIGDIAGEKERGTASLILSKPMPRGTFVTSKFLSQLLALFIGLIVAWAGGYFYTLVLFEPADPGLLTVQFAWINLLMFIWLSAYVTVALISSVLSSSVTGAGGLAVLGSILLMLAGNIPQVGSLLPGALTTWASQLILDAEIPVNGGALAFSLVLALVGVVVSIAIFEQQELP